MGEWAILHTLRCDIVRVLVTSYAISIDIISFRRRWGVPTFSMVTLLLVLGFEGRALLPVLV